MVSIPDDKVQEVRDRVDIVDLVGRYVELRRAGQNWKGLCPFHGERTPSFNVNPARKGYKCFGCGAGGDAIRFVMELEGKSFPEAVRKLAELYGVHIPDGGATPRDGARSDKDDAYALTRLAADLWRTILVREEAGERGREYLHARGLGDEIAESFRLGYAPAPAEAGWDRLARTIAERRLPLPLAEKLGLVGRSERSGAPYDRFRGRLMFPVTVPGGEVVAFSGRIVPPHDTPPAHEDAKTIPKYYNSPESLLYSKGKTLFGLAVARPTMARTRRAILVEGNVDVVKLHQWGHAETVAPLGTALTADQARLLARFVEQVVLCFDGDDAGKKAAWAALPHVLEADLDVRMVVLPAGEDPDSVGNDRLTQLLQHARPALEEMMERMADRAGSAIDARGRALDRIVPLIARTARESVRALYADRAAELFGVKPSQVQAAIRNAGKPARPPVQSRQEPEENSRRFHSTSDRPVPLSAPVRPLEPLPAGQADLTMLLVDAPHLAAVAERGGAVECITDARLRPVVDAVLEGARAGRDPSLSDLLALVDDAAQEQVHDAVFVGRYRDLSTDPQAVLAALVARCRREAIERDIEALDRRIEAARRDGFPERATELEQQKLLLRRQASLFVTAPS